MPEPIYLDDGSDWDAPSDLSRTVEVADNPVLGVLYGPDGDVLRVMHERNPVVGFARWRRA